jgi:hypothetical protein
VRLASLKATALPSNEKFVSDLKQVTCRKQLRAEAGSKEGIFSDHDPSMAVKRIKK